MDSGLCRVRYKVHERDPDVRMRNSDTFPTSSGGKFLDFPDLYQLHMAETVHPGDLGREAFLVRKNGIDRALPESFNPG